MSAYGTEAARESASAITQQVRFRPRIGVILGSGLGGIAHAIEGATRIPYDRIPGFPASTVAGHAGELVAGTLAATPVVAL